MSRQIDYSKPLSDDDRAWLHEWSLDYLIDANDRQFDKKYQKSTGPEIVEDPNRAPNTPRLPANFATDQQATGPVYPLAVPVNPPTQQEYAQPAAEEVVEVYPEDMTVDELKDELRKLDQPVSGDKKELVKRLNKALE